MPARYADYREARRFRALELHEQGWTGAAIAQALGVSEGAVSGWLKTARTEGRQALRSAPRPRGPFRLTTAQLELLAKLLAEGAQAHGFEGERWTRKRVRTLLKRHFGVTYSIWQIGRILRQQGLSVQKPVQRAAERDETAIKGWQAERLPAIQKTGGS